MDSLRHTDILRLLKHKARFPAYTIIPIAAPSIGPDTVTSLSALLDNNNAKGQRWIKSSIVRQVRIGGGGYAGTDHTIRVVIKERYAPDWMKAISVYQDVRPKHLAKELGFERCGWNVDFGVDYS